jgi:hypothetical protein
MKNFQFTDEMTKFHAYIAVPYSHECYAVREYRYLKVTEFAGKLINRGIYVYSPITHSHPMAKMCNLRGDWEFWEQYDKLMLQHCEKLIVLMLEGWEQSTGVQAEILHAKQLGLIVEYTKGE